MLPGKPILVKYSTAVKKLDDQEGGAIREQLMGDINKLIGAKNRREALPDDFERDPGPSSSFYMKSMIQCYAQQGGNFQILDS